jgi:succinyl-diaminopimelate desuccinylase
MARVKFSEILHHINEKEVIDLARDLIRIPSENPPGNEKEVAEFIHTKMKEIGLDAVAVEAERNRPNIIGRLKGKNPHPRLLLNGHTDVVPAGEGWQVDPYQGVIKNGKLYGRGAADMKGGIAAMLMAAKAIQNSGIEIEGELLLAAVVDEETGGEKGTGFLVERKVITADMAIVCEPSNFRLSVSESGVAWIKIKTSGKMVHTIHADTVQNPIIKMANAILALEKLKQELSTFKHEKYGKPILSVNMISAGYKENIIPGTCHASIDLRFPPELSIKFDDVIEQIRECVKEYVADFKVITVARPFTQPEDTEIVKLIMEATKEVKGEYPSFWNKSSNNQIPKEDSDVYHLWVKGRIPSVYFGPGEVELAHCANEYINVKDIIEATKIYTLIAYKLLCKGQ